MGGATRNPFWDFSVAVYGRPGVADACLALQDRHGLDVNVLLFCAWAGRRGHALQGAEIADLIGTARPWQKDIVEPLREVRRRLKAMQAPPDSAIDRLRRQLKDIELAAEAVEQGLLFNCLACADGDGPPAIVGGNMITYLTAMRIAADAADVANLASVVRGCYQDLSPLHAVWAIPGD